MEVKNCYEIFDKIPDCFVCHTCECRRDDWAEIALFAQVYEDYLKKFFFGRQMEIQVFLTKIFYKRW